MESHENEDKGELPTFGNAPDDVGRRTIPMEHGIPGYGWQAAVHDTWARIWSPIGSRPSMINPCSWDSNQMQLAKQHAVTNNSPSSYHTAPNKQSPSFSSR